MTNAQLLMTLTTSYGVLQKWIKMEIMCNQEDTGVTVVRTAPQDL